MIQPTTSCIPREVTTTSPIYAGTTIGNQITEWLNLVPQCQINISTQKIADKLNTIVLDMGEVIISFDLVSLYTNVPVQEAIMVCADLMYSGEHTLLPVDKETFKELHELCACNVLMQTHHGFYW